jgi:uncharacterized protein YeaO (DUF488 family)
MKIYTSNFKNMHGLPKTVIPIAICLYPPPAFWGPVYGKLAPKSRWFNKYKGDGNWDSFSRHYVEDVLSSLRQGEVRADLKALGHGSDVALLCYEGANENCHRHLVAEWLGGVDEYIGGI